MMSNFGVGKSIVVADDLASNRLLLQGVLEKSGYRTIGAEGGNDCIKLVQQHRPDLVLLDIMMPDVSGIEVCKRLHAIPESAAIPVVFVTSATDDGTLTKAFDAGGSDYVRKPVNKVELLKRIEVVLEHQQLEEKKKEEEKLLCVLAMSGTICHELNQPLQYISGMSQLLLMDLEKGSGPHKTVVKMQAQIERMGEITKKLMQISKVEARDYVGDAKVLTFGS